MKKTKKSLGQISQNLLLLAGLIIITVVIFVLIINWLKKSPLPEPPPEPSPELPPPPVYEVSIGNIRFKLKEAKDIGNILKASEAKYFVRDDISTTERFIQVTITAENIGTDNIKGTLWEIRELYDSEERKFYSTRDRDPWIPDTSQCESLLKPGFTPTPCTKIYEVAKISKDLKVEVYSKEPGQGDFIDIDLTLELEDSELEDMDSTNNEINNE